jgi:Flp pilus assembly pilin Flp
MDEVNMGCRIPRASFGSCIPCPRSHVQGCPIYNRPISRTGKMKKMLRFFEDENGATSVEYALLAVFIAVVIVAAVTLFGQRVAQLFEAARAIFD